MWDSVISACSGVHWGSWNVSITDGGITEKVRVGDHGFNIKYRVGNDLNSV